MSISKIKENAKTALAGKWGKGIGIFFAYLAISFFIGLITGIFEKVAVIGLILQIVSLIIEIPITFGIGYTFIKLKRNEKVGAFDFIDLGFSNFGRSWKICLRTVLKMILPIIGTALGLALVYGGVVYSVFSMAASAVNGGTAKSAIGLMVVGLILYVVSVIWLLVRSLLYSLTTLVAYDNQNSNSLEVVNESSRLMKGNRGKLFLLELSFALWYFIPIILINVGLVIPGILILLGLYVWLFPYMQVALVCFYDELSGKNVNNNPIENSENITNVITEI